MLKIYYTNLGLYNEGILKGEWVELPVSDEELKEVMKRNGYDDRHEEFFITDYECDVPGVTVEEYDSIEYLNDLAEATETSPGEVEALFFFGPDRGDFISNQLDNISYITHRSGIESMDEAIGYYWAVEAGTIDIPENLQPYFDYEKYGRDIRLEGNYCENEDGAIYEIIY